MNRRNDSVPTLEQWKLLSDLERAELMSKWDTYGGEGKELVNDIAAEVRNRYGKLREVKVGTPGIFHGGSWVIAVEHPFVFDRRTLPSMYLGVPIHISILEELPPEFREGTRQYEYVWAPPHYERFVDRNFDAIRQQLGNSELGREDILSALECHFSS